MAIAKISPLPRHVAIIMDGNGRWAQARGLPRLEGHRAGTGNIRRVVAAFAEYGIPYLTLFAFSTENWSRPRSEVRGLFGILRQVIRREVKSLHEQGVRLCHVGSLEGLSKSLQQEVLRAIELTRDNQRLTLNIAFNYGGRAEVLEAVRALLRRRASPEEVTEELFASHLYTAGQPDPDLIVRTAGEMRISNFLLWQAAYAEYYATPVLWPDFDEKEVEKALLAFSQRQRRFGGLTP